MDRLESLDIEMQKCEMTHLGKMGVNIYDLSQGYGKIEGNGEGNRYMFVGQNPSEHRHPWLIGAFQGGYGDVFRSRLALAGYDVGKDCFFTNVVKCSTWNNTNPGIDQARICGRLWLEHEISIVDPMLIIAMGGLACQYFGIKFGQSKIYGGREVYGIWHPSYVDRDRSKEQQYLEQLKEAKWRGGRQQRMFS